MEQRVHQGYAITDSVHVGNEEFVIGEKETCVGTMYVTWRNWGKDDFILGHYFDDRFAAENDLLDRAACELENQKRLNKLNDLPMIGAESYSPWGKVTLWQMHCPGVYTVTTATHGGIEVAEEVADKYFTPAALQCSFFEHGYYWFEEDYAIAVAYRELMDKGILVIPKDHDSGKFERNTNKCIQRHFPKYWQAREKMLAHLKPKHRARDDER